ncbi:MAG: rRNA pseudouridine synthase [Candidatus Hydrogenedentes bacterium]|nr:rRNA pseudouridine synthase [Candidatus Hydrogenedentota bacterium]
MIRLQKFLAECGLASRRTAEQLVASGRVTVNGKTAQLGDSIDPTSDQVLFDGKPVSSEKKVYILLNKPPGVISSVRDTHHRKTVLDCLTGVHARVFPVGRLDLDVEGALLLTNDGELAYRLTHPRYQVDKVYLARVKGAMSPETAMRLEKGVVLEDGATAPAKARILNRGARDTLIQLTLREGRKREVKRMCESVGHPVWELRRVAIANVRVKGLKPGEWRRLSDSEVLKLRQLTGLHR